MKTRNRIWELDFLRGLSIILLIFDHFMFYITMIPNFFGNYHIINCPFVENMVHLGYQYWESSIRGIGHVIFVSIFLLLVGISSTFSHSNVKRGIKIFLFGEVLTIGSLILTALGIPEVIIWFGILHLIGVGILLYVLVDKLPCSKLIFLISGFVILLIGISHNMFFPPYYPNVHNFKQVMDMLIGNIITGGDSFGLYYVGIIFIGAFLGKTIYDNKRSLLPKLDGSWNKPICCAGRNTLIVYIVSPIISCILIFIVCLCLGYRF